MSAEEQPHGMEGQRHDHGSAHHDHGSGAMNTAALLYALCLTMLGFMLPLSSYVALEPFPPWGLAGFYIAIYALAIAFLLFFVAWVARRPPIPVPNGGCQQRDDEAAAAMDAAQAPTDATTRRRGLGVRRVNSRLLQSARQLGVQEIPVCSLLSQADSHAPSFFMRVACFIFGSLKVAHEALMIVDALTDVTGGCAGSRSESAGLVTQYVLSISFTILQTFFIFKYSKVSVNVYRKISTLGFMHLVATNLCDWFLATLMETSHSAYKTASRSSSSTSYSSSSYGSNITSSCSKAVFWRMAPYLLPFTIEYALMAAVSAYALRENIGKLFSALHQTGAHGSSALLRCLRKCRDGSLGQSKLSAVNCLRSGRGFIVGSFLLIAGFVSGIYFTVYVNDKPNDPVTSQLIYQVTDLILLSANLLLCVVAYCKMRRLTQVHKADATGPDAWLLGITLIGVLAFQLFQLFGSTAEEVGAFLGLRVAQGVLAITQSVFQVFLIFEVEHRRCKTLQAIKTMPGREELAALMLGNAALWIVYTLEIREINYLPNYGKAYASVATDIVTYTCSPLIIFFRFHCACCFVEIWRTAYKTKTKPSGIAQPGNGSLDTVAMSNASW